MCPAHHFEADHSPTWSININRTIAFALVSVALGFSSASSQEGILSRTGRGLTTQAEAFATPSKPRSLAARLTPRTVKSSPAL